MNKKLLVVVDMQNDFVTGALPNETAQAFVPKMVQYIRDFDGDVVFTQDTHDENYMNTQEGRKLPVPHCITGTEGWEIIPELQEFTDEFKMNVFKKPTFGSIELAKYIAAADYGEVYFCGVCTGICVINNVALTKAYCPELPVKVVEDLCACVTPETHKNAIEAMKVFQVDIV